jgi:hypothetical protein
MIEDKEIRQLIKSTILSYLNKETISEEELDWKEIMIEAEVSWENQVLTEFGLTNSTEDEKREFLKTYIEDWKNSFLEEEYYFEPDISPDDEELFSNILEIENQKIELNNFFTWLDSQEFNSKQSKEKISKIKLNCSPTNFKKLLVKFFENKGVIVDDDKLNRITYFIANCFSWSSKYPFKNKGNETINFLDRKSLMLLISLIIFLNRIDKKIEFKSTTALANLLNNELKQNNQKHIGLSNNLRNEITKHILNKTTIELCKLAGFKNSSEINYIISN